MQVQLDQQALLVLKVILVLLVLKVILVLLALKAIPAKEVKTATASLLKLKMITKTVLIPSLLPTKLMAQSLLPSLKTVKTVKTVKTELLALKATKVTLVQLVRKVKKATKATASQVKL